MKGSADDILSFYRDIFGEEATISPAHAQIFYHALLDEKFIDNSEDVRKTMANMRQATGVEPIWDQTKVDAFYKSILVSEDNKFLLSPGGRLLKIYDLLGIRKDWSTDRALVEQCYNKLIQKTDIKNLLSFVNILRFATDIEPKFDKQCVQQRYEVEFNKYYSTGEKSDLREIFTTVSILESDRRKIFTQIKQITGQSIDWQTPNMNVVIQKVYLRILRDGIHYEEAIQLWQAETGIKPTWDNQSDLWKVYIYLINNSALRDDVGETLLDYYNITGFKPDWSEDSNKAAVQQRYNRFVNEDEIPLAKINKNIVSLEKATNLTPIFESASVQKKYLSLTHFASTTAEDFVGLYELTRVRATIETISAILAEALPQGAGTNLRLYFAQMLVDQFGYHPDTNMVGALVKKLISEHDEFFYNYSAIKTYSKYPVVQTIIKVAQPYDDMFTRLRVLQPHARNADNDPWRLELKPLLTTALKNGAFSSERPADAAIVVGFVEQMGMINLPLVFQIYADCQRASTFDDLPPATVNLLSEFGFRLKKSITDKTTGEVREVWRFPSPRSVVNELVKITSRFQRDLLDSRVPEGITSTLGNELFNYIRGRTQWARNHALGDLVKKWQTTVEQHPEMAAVPAGFQVEQFEVPKKVSTVTTTEDENQRTLRLNEFLTSLEVQQNYLPQANAWHEACSVENWSEWWKQQQTLLMAEMKPAEADLAERLAMTTEDVDAKIAAATTDADKKKWTNWRKAMDKAPVRNKLTAEVTTWQERRATTAAIEFIEFIPWLEQLIALDITSPTITRLRRTASAGHMLQLMPHDRIDSMRTLFAAETTPNLDRLRTVADTTRQYVNEHYLHPEQLADHTGHPPLSAAALKALQADWQLTAGVKNRFPIETVYYKANGIINPMAIDQTEKVNVSLRPVTGILAVVSGDIGDACYTSQHHPLAEGKHPGIHAQIFTTPARGENMTIQGSVLFVETKREDEVPTIIVRANNPKQNFAESVDANVLVMSTLRAAVATAKRLREERLAKAAVAGQTLETSQQRQAVVIPLDNASTSCSNRPAVATVYHNRFKETQKTGLANTPDTNFNHYNNWNESGNHACGVIWEMDENGAEHYYGVWE